VQAFSGEMPEDHSGAFGRTPEGVHDLARNQEEADPYCHSRFMALKRKTEHAGVEPQGFDTGRLSLPFDPLTVMNGGAFAVPQVWMRNDRRVRS
jgi:hypothetical protein